MDENKKDDDMIRIEDYNFKVVWNFILRVYIGTVDEFPRLAVTADSREEALEKIKEVTTMWVLDLRSKGATVPRPHRLESMHDKTAYRS